MRARRARMFRELLVRRSGPVRVIVRPCDLPYSSWRYDTS